MDKEYERIQFGVDSKKLHFKTNGGKLTEVKFKIHFPNKFKFLKAVLVNNELIKVDFKGLDGCTVADNLMKSTKEEIENIDVDLSKVKVIPKSIRIEYELVEVENCDKPGFVPETAGGGILVGTGG